MRPNQYSSEKRRKELDRKKKMEEKAAKKLERKLHPEGENPEEGSSEAAGGEDSDEAEPGEPDAGAER